LSLVATSSLQVAKDETPAGFAQRLWLECLALMSNQACRSSKAKLSAARAFLLLASENQSREQSDQSLSTVKSLGGAVHREKWMLH
jgi:hypothetical protein